MKLPKTIFMINDTPENIADILTSLKAKSVLGTNLEQAQIWEQWEAIMPAPYHFQSYPLRVKDKVLFIEVLNAVWMHKISYIKPEILEKIHAIVSAEIIEDLRFTLSKEDKLESPEKKP